MDHKTAENLIYEQAYGELDDTTEQAFLTHLDACTECGNHLFAVQNFLNVYRAAPRPTPPVDIAQKAIAAALEHQIEREAVPLYDDTEAKPDAPSEPVSDRVEMIDAAEPEAVIPFAPNAATAAVAPCPARRPLGRHPLLPVAAMILLLVTGVVVLPNMLNSDSDTRPTPLPKKIPPTEQLKSSPTIAEGKDGKKDSKAEQELAAITPKEEGNVVPKLTAEKTSNPMTPPPALGAELADAVVDVKPEANTQLAFAGTKKDARAKRQENERSALGMLTPPPATGMLADAKPEREADKTAPPARLGEIREAINPRKHNETLAATETKAVGKMIADDAKLPPATEDAEEAEEAELVALDTNDQRRANRQRTVALKRLQKKVVQGSTATATPPTPARTPLPIHIAQAPAPSQPMAENASTNLAKKRDHPDTPVAAKLKPVLSTPELALGEKENDTSNAPTTSTRTQSSQGHAAPYKQKMSQEKSAALLTRTAPRTAAKLPHAEPPLRRRKSAGGGRGKAKRLAADTPTAAEPKNGNTGGALGARLSGAMAASTADRIASSLAEQNRATEKRFARKAEAGKKIEQRKMAGAREFSATGMTPGEPNPRAVRTRKKAKHKMSSTVLFATAQAKYIAGNFSAALGRLKQYAAQERLTPDRQVAVLRLQARCEAGLRDAVALRATLARLTAIQPRSARILTAEYQSLLRLPDSAEAKDAAAVSVADSVKHHKTAAPDAAAKTARSRPHPLARTARDKNTAKRRFSPSTDSYDRE